MSQTIKDLKHQKVSLLTAIIPYMVLAISIFVLTNTINTIQLELSELINNVNALNKTVAILAESQKIQEPIVAKIAADVANPALHDAPFERKVKTATILSVIMILSFFFMIFGRDHIRRARNCSEEDFDSNLTIDKLDIFSSNDFEVKCEINFFDNDMNSDILNNLMALAQTGAFT